MSDPAGRFLPGDLIAGRYRMISLLGRGGMGEVYRADDLTLDQPVALKFLPEDMERDPAKLTRFLDEAKIARRVSHPNVCRVHDVGEVDGHRFLSMEYLDGEDLASLLRRIGRLPKAKGIELGRQLAEGLEAVHRQGILHLDLKPSNVMIDGRGQARITDFGIATLVADFGGVTATHGTPGYMAPEQLAGREVSRRSDLYALGLVLYEMLTGHRAAVQQTTATARPGSYGLETRSMTEPLSQELVELDPAVERIVLACLELDPERRPASAQAVTEALAALEDSGDGWRPEPGGEIPQRRNWSLDRRLDVGGFGEVWIARHVKTDEPRVFKFCHQASKLEALQREVTVFRLLKRELGDRDDIVRILDWSFDEPPFFIESELVAGGDLVRWAEERGGLHQIPLDQRLEIIAQTADAVAAAHSVGVLHQDIKPGNVLIEGGAPDRPRVRLSDFGVGEITEPERLAVAGITVLGLSRQTSSAGTRLYLAPELLEGKAASVRSDIYALGVMLYQMVIGDFSHALAPGWERDIEDPLLQADLAAAVDGSPERRLDNAGELAARLRALDRRRADRSSRRRSRRGRRLLASIAGSLLVLATATGLLAWRVSQEEKQARNAVRLAAAGEWLARDPTRAALVLLEVEEPEKWPLAYAQMGRLLGETIARLELRHEHPVQSVSFSPDGGRLLTAAADAARIWNTEQGSVEVVLKAPRASLVAATSTATSEAQDAILSAIWSPGGEAVVTTSSAGVAHLWPVSNRAEDGRQPVVFTGHEDWVRSASFDPAGDRLLTVSDDGTVRIWSMTGETIRVLPHIGVFAAAFAPSGDHVLSASDEGTVRLWKVHPDDREPPLEIRHEGILSAAWNLASTRSSFETGLVTAGDDGSARVWAADGSGPIELEYNAPLWSASFSADGERILTASVNAAQLWLADRPARARPARGRPAGTSSADAPLLFEHDRTLVFARFSPDGERILTAGLGGSAWLWRSDDASAPLLSFQGPNDVLLAADFHPRSDLLAIASRDGTVRIWPAGRPPAYLGDPRSALAAATRICLHPVFRQTVLDEAHDEAVQRHLECERSQGRNPGANEP